MAQWTVDAKLALLRQHDDGVPWTRLAATAGVPARTLSRWAQQYRMHPTSAALERRPRADKGRQRTSQELVEAIQALALRHPEPTAAFIHRRVSGLARDRGVPAPSYSTVRAVIAAIDPGLRTLAQHGDAAYRDRFELVYRRTATRPNEQWQADHTLLDLAILDRKEEPVRPWLTIVLDDYSRAVAGYTLFLGAPTAERTALALHQAINRKTNPAWPVMGLPEVLYSDHGSDFTSARLERVCLDTHIRLIHSRVGVPQGRGKIERFYGTINTELLPHLPGHIPHCTNGTPSSPAALLYAELRHSGASSQDIIRTRAIVSFAWVAGPPLATLIIGAWGERSILAALALLSTMNMITTAVLIQRRRGRTSIAPESDRPTQKTARVSRWAIVLLVSGFTALQATNSAAVAVMSLFVTEHLDLSLIWAGVALGFAALLEIPALLAVGALDRRVSARVLITSGCLAGIAYYAAMALAQDPAVLMAAQVLNAWFFAVVAGLGLTQFQEAIPRPGLASGLFLNTRRVGSVLSGGIVAVAATHLGYQGVFIVCAGVSALAMPLLLARRADTGTAGGSS